MICVDLLNRKVVIKLNKKLNIFLSYGHAEEGSNVLPPVIEWLKNKLSERKHQVFIDIERLPKAEYTNWPYSDWRSAIFNSINESDSVLGCLSERGLRENGVCLDELSIAVSNPGRNIVTVLLESQAILKVPPTISRIQWVDMSDWEEYYDGNFEDNYFDEKFEEIIKRIESNDNFLYQADINFLIKTLDPSDIIKTSLFDLLRKESKEDGTYIYENRKWLNDIFNSFILSNNNHYLLFTGGPGYGKSQFLAHCIHNFSSVCAYFFIKFDRNQDDCNLFLRTIAFELAAKLPDYRSNLISSIKSYSCYNAKFLGESLSFFRSLNDSELFDKLFHCDKINTIYGGEKIIICIDALDEAELTENDQRKNPIVDLLINKNNLWPRNFNFVLTSRNEEYILKKFELLGNDIQFVSLNNEKSDNDISKYLTNRLVKTGKLKDAYVDSLVLSCEKTFIYADLLAKSLEDGTTTISSEKELSELPKGYKGLLLKYFERLFPGNDYSYVKKALGFMVANNGTMPISVMNEIMRFNDEDWSSVNFIEKMRSFVVKKDNNFCFYHKSVNDWLLSEESSKYHLCLEDYRNSIVEFDKFYISNFEEMERLYADATGFELLDDAVEDGYTYENIKYVYESYMRFAKKIESRKFISNHIAFVALLVYQAYKKSDLYYAKKVFEKVKQISTNFNELNISDKFYLSVIYNFMGEIEIAIGNEISNCYLPDSDEVLLKDCKCAIDYFNYIQNVFPELDKFHGLYCSVKDNIAFIMRNLKEKREEALDILEKLEKYIEVNDFYGKIAAYAHLYYHKSVILYMMSNYEEAINALNESLKYIAAYEDENYGDGLSKKMSCLIFNQLGACYNKIAQLMMINNHHVPLDFNEVQEYYKKSIDYAEKSIKIRIEEYGKMSFYVATAYDNYARWKKNYETSQPNFKKISKEVYDAVKNAIYIKEYLFSKDGMITARSYMTMAFCLADDKKFDEAIKYAERACTIDHDTYVRQLEDIKERCV